MAMCNTTKAACITQLVEPHAAHSWSDMPAGTIPPAISNMSIDHACAAAGALLLRSDHG